MPVNDLRDSDWATIIRDERWHDSRGREGGFERGENGSYVVSSTAPATFISGVNQIFSTRRQGSGTPRVVVYKDL